jgi:hypothetical protein
LLGGRGAGNPHARGPAGPQGGQARSVSQRCSPMARRNEIVCSRGGAGASLGILGGGRDGERNASVGGSGKRGPAGRSLHDVTTVRPQRGRTRGLFPARSYGRASRTPPCTVNGWP